MDRGADCPPLHLLKKQGETEMKKLRTIALAIVALLTAFLLLVGREKLLAPKKA